MKIERNAFMVIPLNTYRHLDEALALAETAGYSVVRLWRTRHPRAIKKGLLEKIKEEASKERPESLIFYGDIQPSSAFNVMKETGLNLVDRVTLILEIFALHASTREAKLQIEAAKIRHEIPLVREIVRRKKLGEDPGFLGPGMYATDQYLRHLTRRLSKIREELDKIRSTREKRLLARSRSGLPHVSIVGYASAGKTSIFNALTGESRPTGPEYFTTLQPKHKGVVIAGRKVILADTVGFIRDVPPEIIEAFHATLSEIKYSDAILFAIDASEPESDIKEKLEAGMDTLSRIGALGLPMIIAANKVDLLGAEARDRLAMIRGLAEGLPGEPQVIPVSAKTREGLAGLATALATLVRRRGVEAR